MPANTSPIYTPTPNVGTARITAQQAGSGKSDGSGTVGTDIFKTFTAGANGSYVRDLTIKPAATAAATTTTATNIRVYLSTVGSGSTTSSDTKLFREIGIPAVSAANTSTPTPDFVIPLGFAIPSGTYIHVGSGNTLAASTEFHTEVVGGDY